MSVPQQQQLRVMLLLHERYTLWIFLNIAALFSSRSPLTWYGIFSISSLSALFKLSTADLIFALWLQWFRPFKISSMSSRSWYDWGPNCKQSVKFKHIKKRPDFTAIPNRLVLEPWPAWIGQRMFLSTERTHFASVKRRDSGLISSDISPIPRWTMLAMNSASTQSFFASIARTL